MKWITFITKGLLSFGIYLNGFFVLDRIRVWKPWRHTPTHKSFTCLPPRGGLLHNAYSPLLRNSKYGWWFDGWLSENCFLLQWNTLRQWPNILSSIVTEWDNANFDKLWPGWNDTLKENGVEGVASIGKLEISLTLQLTLVVPLRLELNFAAV